MKKVILMILMILLTKYTHAQVKESSDDVVTRKYKKISPLEFKHHRFDPQYTGSEYSKVSSLGELGLSSPNFKNLFSKRAKLAPDRLAVVHEIPRLKGPQYKNRRFD